MKIGIVTSNSYEAYLINKEDIKDVKAFSIGNPLMGYRFDLIILPQLDFDSNTYEFTSEFFEQWYNEQLKTKLLPDGKIIQVS